MVKEAKAGARRLDGSTAGKLAMEIVAEHLKEYLGNRPALQSWIDEERFLESCEHRFFADPRFMNPFKGDLKRNCLLAYRRFCKNHFEWYMGEDKMFRLKRNFMLQFWTEQALAC